MGLKPVVTLSYELVFQIVNTIILFITSPPLDNVIVSSQSNVTNKLMLIHPTYFNITSL